ncbi:thiamine pyrophosphate-dependent enzyme [Bacteroidia bacterium]|nr:thiamine pyrophosphate-dependent enzyme [Bacteroidia bacterium]MDA9213680.1 thiamine pyrophosphate-dependent enzyme [Bacteroidia bacterium]
MLDKKILLEAWRLMQTARAMATIYDDNRPVTKYVHSTSKGHEAIQIATGMHLKNIDFVYPYYRDESMLLSMGMTPYELMLQLLAKADDPFSGGRTYYCHPSLNRQDMPKMPHQSSATGMQAIPATGAAHGIKYKETQGMIDGAEKPIVICSLGDGSVTEGEVAESLQMAVLHKLPIIYLIQDNDWGISASGDEMRAMDAFEYGLGFKGLRRIRVNGSDFLQCHDEMKRAIDTVREEREPMLVHVKVPLLGHHTSGVRSEWYRDDLEKHERIDPLPRLKKLLQSVAVTDAELDAITKECEQAVERDFEQAKSANDPAHDTLYDHILAPTDITEEVGVREPEGKEPVVMVDAALFAVDEILKKHPEALLYGQDVGHRLGGVFREAATLSDKYGRDRVFNTPIQEAYIVGSTAGMSAVGCKPIVEIQFADYIWPGVNQLVTELSKSTYLSMGKYPVSSIIRVPTGAYGGGGPYHSGTVESSILPIKGIKIAYPSTAADMKGLMKSAFYDPNPVVMFEHKGLYWSKVPGTELAKTPEPDEDYRIPFGKARVVQNASDDAIEMGESVGVITYGMGVYWSLNASKDFAEKVEVLDLRTLAPYDKEAALNLAERHGKILIVTEETRTNSFAEALAGVLSEAAFQFLDAPVKVIGSEDIPAVPLNMGMESVMLPNAEKVKEELEWLLGY